MERKVFIAYSILGWFMIEPPTTKVVCWTGGERIYHKGGETKNASKCELVQHHRHAHRALACDHNLGNRHALFGHVRTRTPEEIVFLRGVQAFLGGFGGTLQRLPPVARWGSSHNVYTEETKCCLQASISLPS